ncbi:MAG: hypothetical protein LUQ04_11220 [Methanoregula sp.]|nr:hypothetical protein [Methanoregula sp.]
MRTPSLLLVTIILGFSTLSHAQTKLSDGSVVIFASENEARGILTTRDDFIQRLSPFDRSARMKTDKDVSEADFLKFVGNSALAWRDQERRKIEAALQSIQPYLAEISVPLPEKLYVIKTSGNEEGGASYTRTNAIVIPKIKLKEDTREIQKSLCHELFHIATRHNLALQERLYQTIGFRKCNEIEFPSMLIARKITNPDAPKNDHYISLQVGGKPVSAVPILLAVRERYDVNRGGEFFDYLQFRLLLVSRSGERGGVRPLYDGASPRLVNVQQISGFLEQVGANTDYIIHPEEILADNFVLLVLKEQTARTPEVLNRMRTVLLKK